MLSFLFSFRIVFNSHRYLNTPAILLDLFLHLDAILLLADDLEIRLKSLDFARVEQPNDPEKSLKALERWIHK